MKEVSAKMIIVLVDMVAIALVLSVIMLPINMRMTSALRR